MEPTERRVAYNLSGKLYGSDLSPPKVKPESKTCVLLVDSEGGDPVWLRDHGEEEKEGTQPQVHYQGHF